MTTTDKMTHYFTCPNCECKDEITIKECGYGFNTSWGKGKSSLDFEIKWTEPGFCGPEVIECICKHCQTPADHHSKCTYFNNP